MHINWRLVHKSFLLKKVHLYESGISVVSVVVHVELVSIVLVTNIS